MFRIRRIFDDLIPCDQKALARVVEILKKQFPLLNEKELNQFADQLRNPKSARFRSILFVAENIQGNIRGFALLMHDRKLSFSYLDYLSADFGRTGGGIGGALYQRVREEARAMKSIGIFFECLPDDPLLCRNPEILKNNIARLKFYERYGGRPIVGTAYETPMKPGDDNPPYLVFDSLGQDQPLGCEKARVIVRTILEEKYPELCPPEYVEMVVGSFNDDPIRLRPPRYTKTGDQIPVYLGIPEDKKIVLVINDRHEIHHIRERGYVESPVRIQTILKELDRTEYFTRIPPRSFPEIHIHAVHDADFIKYLKNTCEAMEPDESVYPYVFPIRNRARPPKDLSVCAGYYCIDTFTPLNKNAFVAARRGVDCALTAADSLLHGHRLAYALIRPPGHHAERRTFGGFCYLNSSAIAAHFLSNYGKIVILDLDHHHGNGQQNIFYSRADVFTISIHGNPSLTYPYFSGFDDEVGTGAGEGYNWNVPLPENVNGERYRDTLRRVVRRIQNYGPRFLIVSIGFDTARNDPTGSWELTAGDFEVNGRLVGQLRLPTLVVQEGGYNNRVLGTNARNFFRGLWAGAFD
jgi:acetoin utilization deacetylase AcuC-like enzyme